MEVDRTVRAVQKPDLTQSFCCCVSLHRNIMDVHRYSVKLSHYI